jgi:hypothetical protein
MFFTIYFEKFIFSCEVCDNKYQDIPLQLCYLLWSMISYAEENVRFDSKFGYLGVWEERLPFLIMFIRP